MHEDSSDPAGEALVLMLINATEHWKVAIGYFLIHSLNGKDNSNLVTLALEKQHDIAVTISAVTCDGVNVNFTMFMTLGAPFNPSDLKTTFTHPSDSQSKWL